MPHNPNSTRPLTTFQRRVVNLLACRPGSTTQTLCEVLNTSHYATWAACKRVATSAPAPGYKGKLLWTLKPEHVPETLPTDEGERVAPLPTGGSRWATDWQTDGMGRVIGITTRRTA